MVADLATLLNCVVVRLKISHMIEENIQAIMNHVEIFHTPSKMGKKNCEAMSEFLNEIGTSEERSNEIAKREQIPLF